MKSKLLMMTVGSKKKTGRPKKRISNKEKEFAELMLETGLGPIEAARKVFGWRCEPGSSEALKAINLKKAPRIKAYLDKQEEIIVRETEAHKLFLDTETIEWDKLRKFAFDRLTHIRDDPQVKAQIRFNALQALEKLSDPSADSGLINMWLDLLWRGAKAHCPRCHNTFPLWKIKNSNLENYRKQNELEPPVEVGNTFERRMEIIKRSDPRKRPHSGQVLALQAEERHIAGRGPARAGKSVLLAWMALLFFLIPGVEIWVLARIYEDARSEVDYLRRFLNTLFYPYTDKVIKEHFDSRTGELTMISKWGSELKIRSAKAKGSITGRELEAAFVAEPGWVPEDLYEELRARMSSRLGRIIMFGTPKGFGGILGRLLNSTGRDPKTGKVIRLGPEDRTLDKGMPWGVSLFSYNLSPKDNPEYVQSELESARMELLDSEYASEFEGQMTSQEGSKFPQIKNHHLKDIDYNVFNECVFVLGIDQGPKNFAATLLGFNGQTVYVCREYFESDSRTMKHHMDKLRKNVPLWIKHLGGHDDDWILTIFDADPPLSNELSEFEMEGSPWPTDITWRPKNIRGQYNQFNWRPETYEYLNTLGSNNQIEFSLEHCSLLYDQITRVQNKPQAEDREEGPSNAKGWIVNDPWRGDHVVDALMLGLYTIYSGQLVAKVEPLKAHSNPYREQQAAFDYARRMQEARELKGYSGRDYDGNRIFEEEFGRPKPKGVPFGRGVSPYRDY